MARFLWSRLLQSLAVLWIVYTLTFFLLMLAPGDPFVSSDRNTPETVRRALAEKYGLTFLMLSEEQRHQLAPVERLGYISRAYVYYLGRAVTGDFGPTIRYQNFTVADVIRSSLPVSLTLGSAALLIALIAGVAAGTLGAVARHRWPDFLLSIVSLVGVSLPTFVLGSLLLMAFVVAVPLFPAGGWGASGPGFRGMMNGLGRIVLPALTLSLFYLAYIARLSRSSMIDVLSADYVRTARAKGVAPGRVIWRHAGANAALPVLSYLGPAVANILVGSFVVEKLFVVPGMGMHFVNACLNNDIPLVLGEVLVYSALVVFLNVLVDIGYMVADPRIVVR